MDKLFNLEWHKKNWWKDLLFAIAIIAAFLVNPRLGQALGVIIGLALVLAAFWTIRDSIINREKEKKRSILSEIAKWAIDANACVMQIEAPYDVDLSQDAVAIKAATYNTFRVMIIEVIKGTYIRMLANKVFEDYKLGKDIQDILDDLSVLTYLTGLEGNFGEIRETYEKTFCDIVDSEIKADGADKVRVNHETRLVRLIRNLFNKIGDIFNDL